MRLAETAFWCFQVGGASRKRRREVQMPSGNIGLGHVAKWLAPLSPTVPYLADTAASRVVLLHAKALKPSLLQFEIVVFRRNKSEQSLQISQRCGHSFFFSSHTVASEREAGRLDWIVITVLRLALVRFPVGRGQDVQSDGCSPAHRASDR